MSQACGFPVLESPRCIDELHRHTHRGVIKRLSIYFAPVALFVERVILRREEISKGCDDDGTKVVYYQLTPDVLNSSQH
jgi:hypothetical protein